LAAHWARLETLWVRRSARQRTGRLNSRKR